MSSTDTKEQKSGRESLPFPLPEVGIVQVENLPFPLVARGKVRDIFDLGDSLLMVASDRVSAFDVVMGEGVPGKGALLTQISLAWFTKAAAITPHHLVENHTERLAKLAETYPFLAHRSMIVKKLTPLKIEAVVRGYLSGSGWKSYKATGKLFEYDLPEGMLESAKLPRPYFTPSTKADVGIHDEAISCADASALIGKDLFDKIQDLSIQLYEMAAESASNYGVLLADTKFEFGVDADGKLYLIDEILTPDSSRYWPAADYSPGGAQNSFDKQFLRNYLETLDWGKTSPAPPLPANVLEGTLVRYIEAYNTLIAPWSN